MMVNRNICILKNDEMRLLLFFSNSTLISTTFNPTQYSQSLHLFIKILQKQYTLCKYSVNVLYDLYTLAQYRINRNIFILISCK